MKKLPNCEMKYSKIYIIISYLISLPHGKAGVEKLFSNANIIKNNLRNKIKVETLAALIRVRENINDLSKFEPSNVKITSLSKFYNTN